MLFAIPPASFGCINAMLHHFSIFRTIMAIVWGVPNFRIFTVTTLGWLHFKGEQFPLSFLPACSQWCSSIGASRALVGHDQWVKGWPGDLVVPGSSSTWGGDLFNPKWGFHCTQPNMTEILSKRTWNCKSSIHLLERILSFQNRFLWEGFGFSQGSKQEVPKGVFF